MSNLEQDEMIIACPPLFLVQVPANCWKCGQEQIVAALGARSAREDGHMVGERENAESLVLFSYVKTLPDVIHEFISKHAPQIKRQRSKTAHQTYWANSCECGAFFGDHFLMSEPGEAFFPTTESEAGRIELRKIPIESEVALDATVSWGTGDLIMRHGRFSP